MAGSLRPDWSAPDWSALRKELDGLVVEIGAVRAIVMDERGKLFCWSSVQPSLAPGGVVVDEDSEAQQLAKLFYEAELKEQTLRLGRQLSILRRETQEDSYCAESFGEHFVLVVWCHAMFPALSTQAVITKSLPAIETLTKKLAADNITKVVVR